MEIRSLPTNEDHEQERLLLGIATSSDGLGSIAVGSSGCVGSLDFALGRSILDAVGSVLFFALALGFLLLLGGIFALGFIFSFLFLAFGDELLGVGCVIRVSGLGLPLL